MHNGRMEEVQLPDGQYYLESEDKEKILCNADTNEATALKLGRTKVILRDKHIDKDETTVKLPCAMINVVEPAYIVLTIQPHKNWAILIGEQHEILAEVFSR